MEAAMEDAFVEWINTFDVKSYSIDTVVELADGVVLSEILTDIDPKWFKQIKQTETASNWVVRFNNQKKLHKLITRYFEDIVGQDPELLPTVNLTAIAKDADLHELLLMCQLVIAIAVQSDNNKVYIEMIQSLSQKSQHALMVSIEEVMNHFNTEPDYASNNPRLSYLSGNSGGSGTKNFQLDDMPYRYQLEFEKVLLEKKQFETSHSQLLGEYDELRERFEDLLSEKEDLKTRLQDMDEAITQANNTGKADYVMRTEIEHLKQDLERSEDRRQETEMMMENHLESINELKKKVEELTAQAEEASSLRYQLEEYKHAIEKMQKMESTLEKYKRKAEDTSDLKRQIKALEDQNSSLLERSHQVEDEYRKVLAFKTLMDSYKEQVQQLEFGNREILREKTQLEEEMKNLADTCAYLESDRDRNAEQVQLLEEHIKELEFGGGQTLDKVVSHRASVVIDDEGLQGDPSTMEENMKKANLTELRLTIGRLQRQIKELEVKAPIANSLADETEKSKTNTAELQQNYDSIVVERDRLRDELAQIRNGIPDSLLNQTQTIMAFRSRILDLEKESSSLKESTAYLENMVLDGNRSVAKDRMTLQNFDKEHAKIQDRVNRLEDITKMQLHDINRMLVEANYLNGINNSGDEDRPGLSDGDLEVIKEQNASLQIHVLHLQEEINETQGKIRKVRDMIKLYSQLLQEMTARFSNVRKSDEGLIGRTPRTKEEEQDLLKKQIHDVRQQSKIEQQLIISAWYDLVRRSDRDASSLGFRSTPSSWLGRQRKALDVNLRQRLC
ncbi:hypothetical protein HMPREF1544_04041 [Mucor circinelloides 1006PhL]|uniref:Calponin-homology (CH) domain-containing protein n=1 Tax=Mucor circinelloides f. circinelloides (strain 1006PhL) TaxID=1220926 RepID=S2JH16_MUCC1|nr:hypothetical protein HMPREF1544_04041 [Mucor circinelloides 1006PhL]